MIVKLLAEHHLEFLSLNEAAEARPSLHMSKCQIVGNLMPRLNYMYICSTAILTIGPMVSLRMNLSFSFTEI